jgi:tRNA(Ile)-lysidine synthase
VPLREAVREFFTEQRISPRSLLIAASGGPDSTALILAFVEWKDRPFPIAIAHVNHRLRGRESESDAEYVRQLGVRVSVPVVIREGPVDPAILRDTGIEAAAREARYALLRSIRDELGFEWIATGHQQNDQAETLLIRLVTGTGPGRLSGMAPAGEGIVRPLLGVPRSEIERFLRERNLEPRRDRMNEDRRFVRSRMRTEVMPILEVFNPKIISSLAETARQTREQQAALRWLLDRASEAWVEPRRDATRFHISALPENEWIRRALLHREIVRLDPRSREVSAADLERLAKSLRRLRRTTVTGTLEIVRDGEDVVLRRIPPPDEPFERPLQPGRTITLPTGMRMRLERLGVAGSDFRETGPRRQRFQLPSEAKERAFVVRNRRRGDRFHPLGSSREKRLNELLIDRKIPRERRDRIPLLLWKGEIVWIPGVEVSERFKVDEPWREAFEASIEGDDE